MEDQTVDLVDSLETTEEQPVKQKGSKIKEIVAFYKEGKTKEQIIAMGYHKTTVAIQIAAYVKDPKAWNAKYKVPNED